MTESEAKKKWCPIARREDSEITKYVAIENLAIPAATLCKGSVCMMWRWIKEPFKDADLETLEFEMQRSVNWLRAGGVNTVAELCAKSEMDLFRMNGLGRKAIADIKETLKKAGLKLGVPATYLADSGYCGLGGKP